MQVRSKTLVNFNNIPLPSLWICKSCKWKNVLRKKFVILKLLYSDVTVAQILVLFSKWCWYGGLNVQKSGWMSFCYHGIASNINYHHQPVLNRNLGPSVNHLKNRNHMMYVGLHNVLPSKIFCSTESGAPLLGWIFKTMESSLK